ncbi:MAG: hypothetical protein CVT93_02555 [Bacteroidetes bacterium HGW-Bacteroidetes-10]|jgi:hypothetical protein|nr:MAG: hypothetical protein CVT93_02555 [Bacteroidetes bacterium HGW-Bacteroidetes-10]
MLNIDKVSEIKLIISGLLQDLSAVERDEQISPLKWEEIFIAADMIRQKLVTLKDISVKEITVASPEAEEVRKLTQSFAELKRAFADVQLNVSRSIIPAPASVASSRPLSKSAGTNEMVTEIEEEPVIVKPVVRVPEKLAVSDKPHSLFADDDEEELELFDDSVPILDAARNARHSWRTDLPGSKVADIKQAITLNDKLFYIKELFNDDEEQYRLSIERINEMNNLDEAVDYVKGAFPEWDEDSNSVYRFLMILRRRFDA